MFQIEIRKDESGSDTEVFISGEDMAKLSNAKRIIEEALGYSSAPNAGDKKVEETKDDDFIDWDQLKDEHEEAQKIKWAKCPPLIKNFYLEHPDVTSLSPGQVAEFRETNNNIVVTNFDEKSTAPILNPVPSFHQVCFTKICYTTVVPPNSRLIGSS